MPGPHVTPGPGYRAGMNTPGRPDRQASRLPALAGVVLTILIALGIMLAIWLLVL